MEIERERERERDRERLQKKPGTLNALFYSSHH
jgi:hypothetical protein